MTATAEPVVKPRSLALRPSEVVAFLAGGSIEVRRKVHHSNSTVLGYPAKSYWPHLLWEHARPRDKSSLMTIIAGPDEAPSDVHLSVPFRHPDDHPDRGWEIDPDDLAWYRVRPIWEPGDTALHL